MKHETGEDSISSPPPGRLRLLVSIFIIMFIIWQIVLPLNYYTGVDPDIYDERFSWRMFSTLRMQPCSFDVDEVITDPDGRTVTRKVDMEKSLDRIWITQFGKNVSEVVKKFLEKRCESHPWITSVNYTRSCRSPNGESFLPSDRTKLDCTTGEFTVIRGQK